MKRKVDLNFDLTTNDVDLTSSVMSDISDVNSSTRLLDTSGVNSPKFKNVKSEKIMNSIEYANNNANFIKNSNTLDNSKNDELIES